MTVVPDRFNQGDTRRPSLAIVRLLDSKAIESQWAVDVGGRVVAVFNGRERLNAVDFANGYNLGARRYQAVYRSCGICVPFWLWRLTPHRCRALELS